MEKIIEIKEVENVPCSKEYNWERGDGFEIVTDKQTVKLLISNGQSCCEDWGYFMSEDDVQQFVGSDLIDISITDNLLNTKKFDERHPYGISEGDIMFVNLQTTNGLLQFVAYNAHNGYYGHSAYVISEQLNHEKTL